jgi:hypothetical protein
MSAQPAPQPDPQRPATPTPDAHAWRSRRRHERHTLHISVNVVEVDGEGLPGREWACRTANISRGGVGLHSDRMVHRGRVLLVVMPEADGKTQRLLAGVVRGAVYQAGKGYLLGLEFTEIPDTPALWAWRLERGLAPGDKQAA